MYMKGFMCESCSRENSNPICLAFNNKGKRIYIESETQSAVLLAFATPRQKKLCYEFFRDNNENIYEAAITITNLRYPRS